MNGKNYKSCQAQKQQITFRKIYIILLNSKVTSIFQFIKYFFFKLPLLNLTYKHQKYLMFDADEIGNFGPQPKCKHGDDRDHIVLHLKLMRVPFKGKIPTRIIRPALNYFGVFRSQDSYDHLCIFADIKCKKCSKQSVFTLEFEKDGPDKRRGYYKKGAKLSDQIVCPARWHVEWARVVDLYNEVACSMGTYNIFRNNCQDFTRALWPKVKQYARSCRP